MIETGENRKPLSSVSFVTVILPTLPLLDYVDMFIAALCVCVLMQVGHFEPVNFNVYFVGRSLIF